MTTESPQTINPTPMPLATGKYGQPGEDLIAHRSDCSGARLKHATGQRYGGRARRVDITTCEGCGARHIHRIDIELVGQVPED